MKLTKIDYGNLALEIFTLVIAVVVAMYILRQAEISNSSYSNWAGAIVTFVFAFSVGRGARAIKNRFKEWLSDGSGSNSNT